MKKTKLSFASIILSAITLCCTGCQFLPTSSSAADPKLAQAPDYSKYVEVFDSYAYSGPNDGTYTIDGVVYDTGANLLTEEHLGNYKAVGLNIWLPQSDLKIAGGFNEQVWENEIKPYMDMAHKLGLKVILNDQNIQWLSYQNCPLIGEDDPSTEKVEAYGFDDEAALDAYVANCCALYKDHPAFYGLMLGDEPRPYKVTAYGQTYASIRRVLGDDVFVQYNLLPGDMGYHEEGRFPELTEEEDDPNFTEYERTLKQYEKYLNMFLDVLPGIGYLQYDDYPVHEGYLDEDYIPSLQVAAKVAAERGLELHVVSQTFAMKTNGPDGVLHWKTPAKEDLQWMNNILLGFGVKQIHYFTYVTKGDNKSNGEYFIDGASFVTRTGEKTKLYDAMKEIIANNQTFAPVIKQFAYQGCKKYCVTPTNFNITQFVQIDNSYTFKKLKDVSINKEIALVSELYDKENDNYMYMVMNLLGAGCEGSRAYQTTVLTFPAEYTHAVVYKNGVGTPQKLEDGNKLTIKLPATEAAYVLPY